MRAAKLDSRRRIVTRTKLIVAHLEGIFDAQPANRTWQGLIQQLATKINKTAAVSAQKPLVAGRAKGIDLHSLHIDCKRAGRLARVDDQSVRAFCFAGHRRVEAKAI